jgi:hypothetical protein
MFTSKTLRPGGSLLLAVLALVLALGGTATAAKLITGKQIKNSSLTGADVKNSSLTGADVKNASIGPSDLTADARVAASGKGDPGAPGAPGATGAKGEKGDKGDKGDPGTNGTNGTNGADGRTRVLFSRNTAGTTTAADEAIILGKGIGTGAHLVQVTLRVRSGGAAPRAGSCRLLNAFVPGTDLDARVVNFYEPIEAHEITMQAAFPNGGFPQVKCRGEGNLPVQFAFASMAATAVDELTIDGE